MKENVEIKNGRIRRMLGFYNMVPNLLWSIINLVPISMYCYREMSLVWLFVFLLISLAPILLTIKFIDRIQPGRTTAFYKKLGVPVVNKLTQNGPFINRLMRKKFPEYKVVSYQRSSIKKLLQQTYVFEKFHLAVFVFFSLTTVYALSKHHFTWAVVITITNIIYNVYPNLLQQYIRLKLLLYSKKQDKTLAPQ